MLLEQYLSSPSETDGFGHLIEEETSRERKNKSGETPLHVAAKNGNVALFDALLGLGVFDICNATTYGQTALLVASLGLERKAEIMRKLINFEESSEEKAAFEYGRINMQDGEGKTALHLASASGIICAITTLLDHSVMNINFREQTSEVRFYDAVFWPFFGSFLVVFP